MLLVFPSYRTAEWLLLSYPVSWLLTLLGQTVCLYFTRKRAFAAACAPEAAG